MAGMLLVAGFAAIAGFSPNVQALTFFQDDFDGIPQAWVTLPLGNAWHEASSIPGPGLDPCYGSVAANHPVSSASLPDAFGFHFDTAPPGLTACTYDLDDGTGVPLAHSGTLTSPQFSLTAVPAPVWLHFSTWRETEGSATFDTMRVYYFDGGFGPIEILQVIDPASPQTTWETMHADLSGAAGSPNVVIIFEFDTIDEQSNSFAGWYVDDVLVDDVPPLPDLLTITPLDFSPATAAQGTNDVVMAALDLNTSTGSVTVNSVTVDLTGNPPLDGDVTLVNLYLDDGSAVFDVGDALVGFGPFFAGTVTIPLGIQVTVTAPTTERVWVTYDIDAAAVVLDLVGFLIVDGTYVTVNAPDTTTCPTCPLDTYDGSKTLITGVAGGDTVTFRVNDLAPNAVQPGQAAVMAGINVTVNANDAIVTGLQVDLTGLPPVGTDVNLVFVFWDMNRNGIYEGGGADPGVGFGGFVGLTATINFLGMVPVTAGTPELLWLVYFIAPGANLGDFVGASFTDATDFTVMAPDTTGCANCPYDSYQVGVKTEIVAPTPDIVTFLPTDLAPASVTVGSTDVLMAGVNVTVTTNDTIVNAIRVDLTGAPPPLDADITQALLWYDFDRDGAFNPFVDVNLDTQVFAGGTLTFALFLLVDVANPAQFWVTYDIAGGAIPGDYIGAGFVDATYFGVNAPDTTACAACPVDTYVPVTKTLILGTVDTLTVSPSSIAIPSVGQGTINVPVLRLDLSADANTVLLQTVDVALTGTGTDTDIAAVFALLDNGDLTYGPGDTVLDTQTFNAGVTTLTLGVTVAAANDEIVWVGVDISGTAAVGVYVGGRVESPYFIVAAPDLVTCTGCPVDTYIPATQTLITGVANTAPEAQNPTVDAFAALTPGIGHILTANPLFAWTYFDTDGDPQTDYEVNVSTAPGASGDVWATGPVTSGAGNVAYGGPALLDGSNYWYAVRVSDGTDWSGFNEIMFHMNTPPAAPVLQIPANGDTTVPPGVVALTWLASTDAEGDSPITYSWQLSVDPLFGTIFDSGTGAVLTANTIATAPTTTYYWRVLGNDGWEPGAYGGPFNFTTTTPPPNTDPLAQTLTVDGFAPASAGIVHILTASPLFAWAYFDADGDLQTDYEVRVSSTAAYTGDIWMPGPFGATGLSRAYGGPALADGTDYYLGVQVFDGTAWSFPNLELFHTNGIPPAPIAPTVPADGANITAGASTTITWTSGGADPEADPVTYNWEVATDALFTFVVASGSTAVGVTTSGPFSTIAGTTYYWRAEACDDYECSAWSVWGFNTSAVTPGNNDPVASSLGVDTFLTGTGGVVHILTANPMFNWSYFDADSDVQTEWQVYVGTAAGLSDVWDSTALPGSATSATFNGTALLDGTDYWLSVRVSDGQNWSAWNTTRFHMNAPPSAPTLTTPANGTASVALGTVSLGWTASTDTENDSPLTYTWELGNDLTFASIFRTGSGTGLTGSLTGAVAGAKYYWRVRANDGYESGPNSAAFEFTMAAAAATGSVTVTVTGPDGAIPGAMVTLVGLNPMPTNSTGVAVFTNVPQGSYPITVTATGYENHTGSTAAVLLTDLDDTVAITMTRTPTGGQTPTTDYTWLILLILIVLAVLFLLFFLMKRRKKTEEVPGDAATTPPTPSPEELPAPDDGASSPSPPAVPEENPPQA